MQLPFVISDNNEFNSRRQSQDESISADLAICTIAVVDGSYFHCLDQ
jgi:hypothetical protein